jgi:hypothetical protein
MHRLSFISRRAAIVVTGLLALAAPSAAMAADTPLTTDLTAGALGMSAPTAVSVTAPLTGLANAQVDGSVPSWNVNDASGAGKGWTLGVKLSAFTLAGGTVRMRALDNPTAPADQDLTTAPTLTAGDVGGYLPALTGTDTIVADAAADKGMGLWSWDTVADGLRVNYPSNAKVGTYTGTLTFTLTQKA